MTCPRCQQDNPSRAKFCLECGTPVDVRLSIQEPNADLKSEMDDLHRSLREAIDQQTATSEILQVMSSSPTDVQPVFDTIVRSATQLCRAAMASVSLSDGRMLYLPANYGSLPDAMAEVRARFPRPLDRETVTGRAILTRSVVHVPDVQDASVPEFTREAGRVLGYRSVLAVPMLRDGEAVGAINVTRREPGSFGDTEVALLKTFADQAVIAIENVRLFTELGARNRDLTETLERQTATAEILSVISSSPTGVQPTFDAIARSAALLCRADLSGVHRFDGELIHFAAQYGRTAGEIEAVRLAFPQRPGRASATARCILSASVVQIADHHDDPDIVDSLRMFRTVLAVPMLREGRPIGSISVARRVVEPFTEDQVELLKTFADQAVIAIENVRLFTELQDKNRALTAAHAQVTESLEQQTATSEILRVISAVHTDAQPVFDTIVRSAVRLCKAATAAVFLTDGRMLYEPANYGDSPERLAAARARYPRPLDMDTAGGIAILTRSVVHVPDTEDPSAIEWIRQSGRLVG